MVGTDLMPVRGAVPVTVGQSLHGTVAVLTSYIRTWLRKWNSRNLLHAEGTVAQGSLFSTAVTSLHGRAADTGGGLRKF